MADNFNPDANSAKSGGGDSGGGAYPNPHSGKKPNQGGYMGHGGQTDIAYHGPRNPGEDKPGADRNPNAATEKASPGDEG